MSFIDWRIVGNTVIGMMIWWFIVLAWKEISDRFKHWRFNK